MFLRKVGGAALVWRCGELLSKYYSRRRWTLTQTNEEYEKNAPAAKTFKIRPKNFKIAPNQKVKTKGTRMYRIQAFQWDGKMILNELDGIFYPVRFFESFTRFSWKKFPQFSQSFPKLSQFSLLFCQNCIKFVKKYASFFVVKIQRLLKKSIGLRFFEGWDFEPLEFGQLKLFAAWE